MGVTGATCVAGMTASSSSVELGGPVGRKNERPRLPEERGRQGYSGPLCLALRALSPGSARTVGTAHHHSGADGEQRHRPLGALGAERGTYGRSSETVNRRQPLKPGSERVRSG